jgi:hypothetical protein
MAFKNGLTTIDADYIRKFATDSFVKPAIERGEAAIAIPVKTVVTSLKKFGLKSGRTPAICSALGGKKFQEENNIVLDRRDGPPSGQSPTVVFHFRLPGSVHGADSSQTMAESPKERAFRLTEKLRGLLKDEIAAYGGTEAFIRWVRSDEEAE